MLEADDALLLRLIELSEGAQSLEHIERKCIFLFIDDEKIEYDPKAVKKVLLKGAALEVLQTVRDKLAEMDEFTEETLETMLRGLAEARQVGLGKVAQPLRVALCGTTVSLSIFDSVKLLGKERTLKRIDLTLEKFRATAQQQAE
jgi:glutamyl-tRNA synthetase